MTTRTAAPPPLPVVAATSERAAAFLSAHKASWRDHNVPYEDGIDLEALVIGCGAKSILEIGTSTGHSTIWLAKGALQTGGRVTTIEVNPGRRAQAIRNFRGAGVSGIVESILGDAVSVLQELPGRFDFVFSDATWSTQPADGYVRFFELAERRLQVGGLFTMHNVIDGYGDDGRFFRHLEKLGNYQTRILRSSAAGISVSRKIKARHGATEKEAKR